MIEVQLWKLNELLEQVSVVNEEDAEKLINLFIFLIVRGRIGYGRYKIDADYVNQSGLFAGQFHSQPWINVPLFGNRH